MLNVNHLVGLVHRTVSALATREVKGWSDFAPWLHASYMLYVDHLGSLVYCTVSAIATRKVKGWLL